MQLCSLNKACPSGVVGGGWPPFDMWEGRPSECPNDPMSSPMGPAAERGTWRMARSDTRGDNCSPICAAWPYQSMRPRRRASSPYLGCCLLLPAAGDVILSPLSVSLLLLARWCGCSNDRSIQLPHVPGRSPIEIDLCFLVKPRPGFPFVRERDLLLVVASNY